jgi:hypothetical protein
MATQISLKNLLVPSKTVEVEYPGMPGFKINISFLTREILSSIRKKSTKTTFKNRQPVDELNDEIFLELYVREAVKGWSGLKLSYLEQLAPIDLQGQDMDSTLDFSEENALYLMKSSTNFDAFISEQVTDLGNFSTNSSKK